jgi:hypothetical protein
LNNRKDVRFLSRKTPIVLHTLEHVWPRFVQIFGSSKYAPVVGIVENLHMHIFTLARSSTWPFWSNFLRKGNAKNVIFNLRNLLDTHYFRPHLVEHLRSLCDTFCPMELKQTPVRTNVKELCDTGKVYELVQVMGSQTMENYDGHGAAGIEDEDEGISARGEQLGVLTAKFSKIFLSECTYRSLLSQRDDLRALVPIEIGLAPYFKCFTLDVPLNCVNMLERAHIGDTMFVQLYMGVRTALLKKTGALERMVDSLKRTAAFAGLRVRDIEEGFLMKLVANGPQSDVVDDIMEELEMIRPLLPFFKFAIKKSKWPFMQLFSEPFPEAREVLDKVQDAVMEQDSQESTELVIEDADIDRLLAAVEKHIVDNLKHALLAEMRAPLQQIFLNHCGQFPGLTSQELDIDALDITDDKRDIVNACREPTLVKTILFFSEDLDTIDTLLKNKDFEALTARVSELFGVFGPGEHATVTRGISASCFICLKRTHGDWLAICNGRQTVHADCLEHWIRLTAPTAKCPSCRAVF